MTLLEGKVQSGYVTAILVTGITLIAFEVVWGGVESTVPFFDHIIVAILLFGIVEVPRLRDIPNEGLRTLIMALLAIQAIGYIQIHNPDLVTTGATVALVMLFVSSVMISIAIDGLEDNARRATGFVATVQEQSPHYLVIGTAGVLAFL